MKLDWCTYEYHIYFIKVTIMRTMHAFKMTDVSGFRFTNCHCPDACGVKSYGVDLSYAALSTLSVDSLLEENTTNLSWKYHQALEIEQVEQ